MADRFVGAVLCGGASRRMGRDKALLSVGGVPMAVRVADAMRTAGAVRVLAVGGDGDALAALGLEPVADTVQQSGPLAGIVSALGHSGTVTLVAGCDLLHPSPRAMRATLDALAADERADAAVPVLDDHRQWVHAAWRPSALGSLERALGAGRRAVHRAASGLRVREVRGVDPAALADADEPADLPAEDGRGPGTAVG